MFIVLGSIPSSLQFLIVFHVFLFYVFFVVFKALVLAILYLSEILYPGAVVHIWIKRGPDSTALDSTA